MQKVRKAGSHGHTVQRGKLGPTVDVTQWRPEILSDPLRPRVRVLSPTERQHLTQAVAKWREKGFIEPTTAWVTHNPVFVPKHNGDIRVCIDYRPVNAVTRSWDWPLPRIRNMRHRLVGARWYSRFDLKDAFNRISVPLDARPWTAFHTHLGSFQFTVMPFGLCTAPSTYQRFLDWVLHSVQIFVINYVDDILVMAETLGQLKRREKEVLRLLRHHAIEINTEKSERHVRETTFCGLRITPGRIGVALPAEDWPRPTTIPEWQSALGYTNCFRDVVPGYALLTEGLYPARENPPMEERHQRWDRLWTAVTQHFSLSHYKDDQPGSLFVDASQYAVGAVLTQSRQVCAIFSKSLTAPQTRYSATDREHLALLLAVEAFKVFIGSNQAITVNTDHTALLNRKEEDLTPRQVRWKYRITCITNNFRYVPGKDNPADYWSRQGWKGGGDQFRT